MAARRKRVAVATRNKGKLVEIRHALSASGWDFVAGEDLGTGGSRGRQGWTGFEECLLSPADHQGVSRRGPFGGVAHLIPPACSGTWASMGGEIFRKSSVFPPIRKALC
jgi:hypothetical protein